MFRFVEERSLAPLEYNMIPKTHATMWVLVATLDYNNADPTALQKLRRMLLLHTTSTQNQKISYK